VSYRASLAQDDPTNLPKRIVNAQSVLADQASQLGSVRDNLKQQSEALSSQRTGIIQGRKSLAARNRNARAQRPEDVDYSKYDRCPNGASWWQCDHEDLKRAWLEEQLRGSQYEFQKKMEKILDDLQKNQKAVMDGLDDYFRQKQKYDDQKSQYDKSVDTLKSQIKNLEKAVHDEKKGNRIGSLSSKYESRGDPGTISTGSGDPGGKSYGEFQMSSNTGTVKAFVDKNYTADFAGLSPGSAPFDAKWKELAGQHPLEFGDNQYNFIKQTHYDPAVQRVKNNTGVDIDAHSKAVQNAFWSTAVQNGTSGAASLTARALTQASADAGGKDISQLSDAEILKALYDERGRKRPDGKLVHFPSSSDDVQKSLQKRFKDEYDDALKMLDASQGSGLP
jgi:hypothetical protein